MLKTYAGSSYIYMVWVTYKIVFVLCLHHVSCRIDRKIHANRVIKQTLSSNIKNKTLHLCDANRIELNISFDIGLYVNIHIRKS